MIRALLDVPLLARRTHGASLPECEAAFYPDNPNSYLTDQQIALDRRQRVFSLSFIGFALLAILILSVVTRQGFLLVFMLPSIVTVAILTSIHRAAKRREKQTKW